METDVGLRAMRPSRVTRRVVSLAIGTKRIGGGWWRRSRSTAMLLRARAAAARTRASPRTRTAQYRITLRRLRPVIASAARQAPAIGRSSLIGGCCQPARRGRPDGVELAAREPERRGDGLW